MKKSIVIACLVVASTSVFAEFVGTTQGGFTGPSMLKTTVEQAKTFKDDAHVVLEGNIVENLEKEKYLFRDSTGNITIEIDNDNWRGVNVSPEDIIIIHGEIDKEWNSIEIDVDMIIKK